MKTHKQCLRNTVGKKILLVLFVLLSFLSINSCLSSNTVSDVNYLSNEVSKPMIIWWWRLGVDYPETLEKVVESGIFSHIMIVGSHQYDISISSILKDKKLKNMINLCKRRGVNVVWVRWLYPHGRAMRGFKFENAFEAEYYIERIKQLKKEANLLNLNLIGLDVEPYNNKFLMPLKSRKLSFDEFKAMSFAIDKAVKVAGKVNFVLPSSGKHKEHFYNVTRRLSELSISENTYYDIPSLHSFKEEIRRPHDIVGVFVDVTKENLYNKKLPLFTPLDILERQNLWAHKKGLFIYTANKDRAILVANEFLKIKTVYPIGESNNID